MKTFKFLTILVLSVMCAAGSAVVSAMSYQHKETTMDRGSNRYTPQKPQRQQCTTRTERVGNRTRYYQDCRYY